MRARRAEDLQPADRAHLRESVHVRASHAARSQHADHRGLAPREVLHPDRAVRAHAHMLQHAVVDDGERLAGLDRGEQHEAAEGSGAHAILLLRDDPVAFALVHDVGFHADGEVARGRSALHRSPLVGLSSVAGGNADVDARAADRFAHREPRVGFLERLDDEVHAEDLRHVAVVDDESHAE